MRIIVIGAGEVGYHIAERLSHEAHEIVVIERHPDVVRRLEQTLRVRVIEADGSSPRALEAAGFRIVKEQQVVLVPVEDRPGSAAGIFRRIADARVNIRFSYLATRNRLVIAADNLQDLVAALSD